MDTGSNQVNLKGKISRVGILRYSPAAEPILEFTLSVRQELFGKVSRGNFEVLCTGSRAESLVTELKVGREVQIQGSLWSRKYRSKSGEMKDQTCIVINNFGGV